MGVPGLSAVAVRPGTDSDRASSLGRGKHTRSHGQETRDGRLTIGACHLPLRTSAAPGDVVVLVSAPRGAASSNRGMLTRQRLVLLACVVDETLGVPRYYHASAPDWANKRRDRIYTVTQVGSKCHRRTTRRSFTEFLDQSDEAKLRGATAEKSGTKSWKVKYRSFPGTTAVFSRKADITRTRSTPQKE